jgi:predicted AAA+ superfamily ATPase
MLKNRTIETVVEKINKNFKVLLLTGMRQVGNATVLRNF